MFLSFAEEDIKLKQNGIQYGSQWLPSAAWLPAFFKTSFVFSNRKKHRFEKKVEGD